MRVDLNISFPQEYEAFVDTSAAVGAVQYFPPATRSPAFLVSFRLANGAYWTGGFAPGTLATRACTGVYGAPKPTHASVVANGRAYSCDVAMQSAVVLVAELVTQVVCAPALGILLIVEPWQIHAYDAFGLRWSAAPPGGSEGIKIGAVNGRLASVVFEDADGDPVSRFLDLKTSKWNTC
jgi:hypothetical protein